MIVGTAGHIDHGKTALVKSLTGVDADRLKEEKERGITLDLGYAYTPLANGDVLGFIDVPGHEKLVHNMLAGATGIDFLLLVVAADDGVMPQTVEHLQIADLLGLRRGAVALTKIDVATAQQAEEARRQIGTLLAGTALAAIPVFPVDAVEGSGVPALRACLEQAAAEVGAPVVHGGFRLAVDRAFSLKGVGTVVTGTVFSGGVAVEDPLLVAPAGHAVRVRGLHAQNRPAQQGSVGQRCALNLAGIDLQQAGRGDWVTAPFLATATPRIDVAFRLLAHAAPLRHWSMVHLHLGARHLMARIALLEHDVLQPGQGGLAQLVPEQPVCATHGDRFIVRDAAARATIGGGRVLDVHAPARHRKSPQRLAVLRAWQSDTPAQCLQALLAVSPLGVDLRQFCRNANLTDAELQSLLSGTQVVVMEAREMAAAFSPAHLQALQERGLDALAREHAEAADSLGLNQEQLRMRTAPQLSRSVFAALVAHWLQAGLLAKDGAWLHLPGHVIRLGADEEALWRLVEPLLEETPFQPPRVRDIARLLQVEEGRLRQSMRRLARLGRVYLVAHDHYFLTAAVRRLSDIVQEVAQQHPQGEVYAAAFRDRIDTGRKLAIHILEFFDRVGYTRRVREAHRIRNALLDF